MVGVVYSLNHGIHLFYMKTSPDANTPIATRETRVAPQGRRIGTVSPWSRIRTIPSCHPTQKPIPEAASQSPVARAESRPAPHHRLVRCMVVGPLACRESPSLRQHVESSECKWGILDVCGLSRRDATAHSRVVPQ